MSINQKMTALADFIRAKSNTTEKITIDDMLAIMPELGSKNDKQVANDIIALQKTPTVIEIPEGVTEIDNYYLFGGNESFDSEVQQNIEKLILPSTLTSIANNKFSSSSNLSTLYVKNGSISLGENVFSNSTLNNLVVTNNLNNNNTIDNLKNRGYGNLYIIANDCNFNSIYSSLINGVNHTINNVIIYINTINNIASNSFYNFSINSCLLNSKSVTTIKEHAFSNCTFQELRLPESVNYIEDGAFDGNTITKLILPKNMPIENLNDGILSGNTIDTLSVPINWFDDFSESELKTKLFGDTSVTTKLVSIYQNNDLTYARYPMLTLKYSDFTVSSKRSNLINTFYDNNIPNNPMPEYSEENAIVFDIDNDIDTTNIESDDTLTYSFTPQESGVYVFTYTDKDIMQNTNSQNNGNLLFPLRYVIDISNNKFTYYGSDKPMYVELVAGNKYLVLFKKCNGVFNQKVTYANNLNYYQYKITDFNVISALHINIQNAFGTSGRITINNRKYDCTWYRALNTKYSGSYEPYFGSIRNAYPEYYFTDDYEYYECVPDENDNSNVPCALFVDSYYIIICTTNLNNLFGIESLESGDDPEINFAIQTLYSQYNTNITKLP